MDKLDLMNREKSIRGNLVKWWSVNYVVPTTNETDTYELTEAELTETEKLLCDGILEQNDRSDVYEQALNQLEEENTVEDTISASALEEANAIYERLMREAAEDEQKKQDEIEAAKMANM